MVETNLLNYRKDGEPYWCQVKIYPIQNSEGAFTHFIAVEKETDWQAKSVRFCLIQKKSVELFLQLDSHRNQYVIFDYGMFTQL